MCLAVLVRFACGVPATVDWGAAGGGSGWAAVCSGCYEGAHRGIGTKQALAEYKVLMITISESTSQRAHMLAFLEPADVQYARAGVGVH